MEYLSTVQVSSPMDLVSEVLLSMFVLHAGLSPTTVVHCSALIMIFLPSSAYFGILADV